MRSAFVTPLRNIQSLLFECFYEPGKIDYHDGANKIIEIRSILVQRLFETI